MSDVIPTTTTSFMSLDMPEQFGNASAVSFWAEEGISRSYNLTVELLASTGDVDPDDVLFKQMTLTLTDATGPVRYFHGAIRQITANGPATRDMFGYTVNVVPMMWFMTQTEDCRVFQHKTTQGILELLFADADVSPVSFRVYAPPPAREFTVQMNETDFDFAVRLMQEDGWFFYFEHAAGAHTLVITDGNPAFQAVAEPLVTLDAGSSDFATLLEWKPVTATTHGQTALKDYDPTAPSTALESSQNTVLKVAGAAERALFHWPAHSLDVDMVEQRARRLIEAAEANVALIEGRGRHFGFVPGGKFTLARDPQSEAKNQEHVIHSVIHQGREDAIVSGGAGTSYANFFRCFPSDQTWRDLLTRRRPAMHGLYTAVVIGQPGDEIYTDDLGRVKLRFPWDRRGDSTPDGSVWVRVIQPWAGNGWGTQFLPRVGTEVAVAFMDGDPDRPVVVGGLYNGNEKPPFPLPAQKNRTGLRTRSTLKGGTANYSEFSIDDTKGHENVLLHAEKDHTVVVESCQSISVGAVRSVNIGASENITIAKGNTKASDDSKVTFSTDVMEGDATLGVHNGRYNVVTKKQLGLQSTQGDITALTNKGDVSVEAEEGNITLLADKKDVQFKATAGKITEQAPTITRDGDKITDTGTTSIELKVGSNSIKITQQGIEITAMKVTITGTASAELTAPMAKLTGSGMAVIKAPMVTIN